MGIRELTSEKHKLAESTHFMKAVFNRTLPYDLWINWLYQKTLFYSAIEGAAGNLGLLDNLPDIRRHFYLLQDLYQGTNESGLHYNQVVKDYHNYLMMISGDKDKVLAHLYVWYLGDLFGGQMMKNIIKGPHNSLTFKDPALLIKNLKEMLNDSHADEANIAYDWAIKMLSYYDTGFVG